MRWSFLLLVVACSDGTDGDAGMGLDAGPEIDAGSDAGRDAGRDPSDSGTDDAGRDAGMDAGRPIDGGNDAGFDGGGDPCAPRTLPPLATELAASGLTQPIYVTQPPGVTDALYVVEKWGRVVIVRGGAVVGTFLDLRSIIAGPPPHVIASDGEERGLLGLAFHPDYAANGRFFVFYAPYQGATSAERGRNLLEEYRRSAGNPELADPAPVRSFLDDGVAPAGLADPEGNHNGGMIEFWPRSGGGPYFLYVAMGDGGGACDAHGGSGNGQNRTNYFGKIHRLDVDGTAPYAAAGNPFSGAGELRTIWAYGLRNPWRFSFDRDTGDLYIGDVGQGSFEEIDYQPAGSAGGLNYGWRPLEGNCSSRASGCTSPYPSGTCMTAAEQLAAGYTAPIHAEPRSGGVLGLSIAGIGGYVYRGAAIPALRGWYIFGDYGGRNRGAFWVCGGVERDVQRATAISGGEGVASFGEDNAGEIYMVHEASGTIERIIAAP